MRPFVIRAAAALAAVLAMGTLALLPFAGRYLVAEDPLDRADAVVVLAGGRVQRWLEAADLYREGWAPRIVLSNGRHEPGEERLKQMGVRFPGEAELVLDAMVQMRIPADAITIFPHPVDNTAQEAAALRALAPAGGWQRVIVVTSKYHTRRAGFAFRREFRRTPTRVIIRGSRHDTATPRRWWSKRNDIRYVASELPKLIIYWLGVGG